MGGELQKISTKVDDLSKSLVKATSAWNNKEDNLKESKQAVKKLQKTAAELEKQAESKVRRPPVVWAAANVYLRLQHA